MPQLALFASRLFAFKKPCFYGKSGLLSLLVALLSVGAASHAVAQTTQDGDAPFPLRESPVDYFGKETRDRIARLHSDIDAGRVTLKHDERQGWLRSILDALGVPIESQTLVFSKTSVNQRIISPKSPRAIYFNDEVYIGWTPGAPALEITAVDPAKGAMFYTLLQSVNVPPKFEREESCLLCHASVNSLQVPGQLLRSVLTDNVGQPSHGYAKVSHDTQFEHRWGGWYVTGKYENLSHIGNLTTVELREEHKSDPSRSHPLADLRDRFNTAKYLSPHSDVVALMVLDHQTHLHNLLARVTYEEKFQRKPNSEEQLLRYMLFAEAAPLPGLVEGTAGYSAWFEKQGPRDSQGRSLRQFDLNTRLFRYRCSYLIYSAAFEELPAAVKNRLYHRLWEVLTGQDTSPVFAAIPRNERRAILEILRDTKRDLPTEWRE